MEEEAQFVPFTIHIAQSDAAWLAAWAPDPRALGAHAMGLAALRGLLAEDMPKDGQPLGGEIQHARALIENANAQALRAAEPTETLALDDGSDDFVARIARAARGPHAAQPRHDAASRIAALEESVESLRAWSGSRIESLETSLAEAERTLVRLNQRDVKDRLEERIAALEERNAGPRLAGLEARLAEMGNRIDGHATLIRILETAEGMHRNRIAALEGPSMEERIRVSAEWRDKLAEANQRIGAVENRASLLENDAENAAGRIAALEAKP